MIACLSASRDYSVICMYKLVLLVIYVQTAFSASHSFFYPYLHMHGVSSTELKRPIVVRN